MLRISFKTLGDNIGLNVLRHYHQAYQNHRFSQFDYGHEENQKRYKSKTPPEYNLSSVRVPITLVSTKFDALATPMVIFEALCND